MKTMKDNEIRDIISNLSEQLKDDSLFFSGLECKLDAVEQARKREKRMASATLRRIALTIVAGLIAAAVILQLVLTFGLGAYAIAYAILISIFASLILQVVGIS